MSDTVLISRDSANPAIAILTFNRPEVFNAMSAELIHAFRDAALTLRDSPDVRCLILRGAGKAFLAGGDVTMFHRRKDDPTLADEVIPLGDAMHEGIIALREAPFPVIAQIQGAVAGAGLSIAVSCDFAVCSEAATFSSAYTRIGLSPDGGSTFFLPRLVGSKRAAELIMLSETLDAPSALAMGIVNRVVAADNLADEVMKLANKLAAGPTQAFAQTKRLINQSFETPMRAHLDDEIRRFATCASTNDFKEGVTAFVEKRKPQFTGK